MNSEEKKLLDEMKKLGDNDVFEENDGDTSGLAGFKNSNDDQFSESF